MGSDLFEYMPMEPLHPDATSYAVMGMVGPSGNAEPVGNPENLPVSTAGGFDALAEFVAAAQAADEISQHSPDSYGAICMYRGDGRLVQAFGFRDQAAFDKAVTALKVPPYQPSRLVGSGPALTARDLVHARLVQLSHPPRLPQSPPSGGGS